MYKEKVNSMEDRMEWNKKSLREKESFIIQRDAQASAIC